MDHAALLGANHSDESPPSLPPPEGPFNEILEQITDVSSPGLVVRNPPPSLYRGGTVSSPRIQTKRTPLSSLTRGKEESPCFKRLILFFLVSSTLLFVSFILFFLHFKKWICLSQNSFIVRFFICASLAMIGSIALFALPFIYLGRKKRQENIENRKAQSVNKQVNTKTSNYVKGTRQTNEAEQKKQCYSSKYRSLFIFSSLLIALTIIGIILTIVLIKNHLIKNYAFSIKILSYLASYVALSYLFSALPSYLVAKKS